MTTAALLPRVVCATGYAPVGHPAPCDLDLAGTELPPADPAIVARALADAASTVGCYPSSYRLVQRLAERLAVASDRILVTDGSDDALERSFRVSLGAGRRVVLTTPTFEMLPRYAGLTAAEVREVAWGEAAFPLAALISAVDASTGAVAVVSPNNPTGAVATAAELRALAAAAPHALVVIDQAYVEFADDDPLPHLLDFPNVLITRTFSKAWGLPGLRIGFAIGAPEVISAMRRVAPPYAVSGPALVVADAVLAAGDGAVRSRADCLAARRARLEATLRDLGGSPVPSQANFVSDASPRAAWFRDGLAGLGIAVRWLPGTPSDRIRITTPLSPADSDRLERALRTVGDPQALLFDMDGVLADVRESYDAAIVATAASHGVRLGQVDVEAGKAAGNANDDWTLTRNLLAAQGVEVPLDEVIARFESLYRGNSSSPGLCTRETLIPPRALLERLAARLPLGIVTGRPRTDANRFLEQMDLVGMFAVVVTRDDAPLKPDAAPVRLALARLGVERAWLVGDTPDDVRAARGAGVVPIGAVPPFTPIPPLTDALLGAGAARVLTSLVDLPSWLP